jgi:hypothetical protein
VAEFIEHFRCLLWFVGRGCFEAFGRGFTDNEVHCNADGYMSWMPLVENVLADLK